MPNRDSHDAVGVVCGGAAALLAAQPKNCKEAVLAVGLGMVGGVAGARTPDLIEPAENPDHRGVAHSLVAGIGTGCVTAKALQSSFQQANEEPAIRLLRAAVVGFGAGYLSHLVLDGATPKGLPLF